MSVGYPRDGRCRVLLRAAGAPERRRAERGAGVIAFALDGAPGGGWTLRLGDEGAAVEIGVAPADVTVTCALEQWERLVGGKLSPQTAWATGRLAVSGDMRMAQRVRSLLGF